MYYIVQKDCIKIVKMSNISIKVTNVINVEKNVKKSVDKMRKI